MADDDRASREGADVGWLKFAEQGRLVLASGSPRRARLLELVGIKFTRHPAGVTEQIATDDPAERALMLAEAKARSVAGHYPRGIVLGGDTEVVLDGRILGKPANPGHAYEMLMELRGRSHKVVTGLYLMDVPTGKSVAAVEETTVTMRLFSSAEAEHYAYSGEPMDKAGGYGIQGKAAVFVAGIQGCFYNVVGLPLARFAVMMESLWSELRPDGH